MNKKDEDKWVNRYGMIRWIYKINNIPEGKIPRNDTRRGFPASWVERKFQSHIRGRTREAGRKPNENGLAERVWGRRSGPSISGAISMKRFRIQEGSLAPSVVVDESEKFDKALDSSELLTIREWLIVSLPINRSNIARNQRTFCGPV